jgi:pyridoxine 5-phosphate synthase
MPVFITDEAFGVQNFNRLAFERQAQALLARLPVFLQKSDELAASFALKHEPQLSILLTTDEGITAINGRWFNRPWPTNVISFAQQADDLLAAGPDFVLGDIVISVETAAKEAAQSGVPLNLRMEDLLIHGLAHILGEDHEDEQSAVQMRQRESRLKNLLNGGNNMADLCINVDHIATIRQARGGNEPDPVTAASLVELAGADGIVVHLREDRRHIQDRDVTILRQTIKTRLNLEMAATEEMLSIACEIRPDVVTIVPERRQELTTEGGLDVIAHRDTVKRAVSRLHEAGIPVSLFINPEEEQIRTAANVQADCVEIHTGRYADAPSPSQQDEEFDRILEAVRLAAETGLRVHAGHGLNYRNVTRLAAVSFIDEFSIGHAVIARAALVGLERAVREMLSLVKSGVPL